MHNSNVTPFAMMKASPLTPEMYAEHPYLYNASRTRATPPARRDDYELLDAANKVTLEQAFDLAFNTQVWHAELWQARLKTPGKKPTLSASRAMPVSARLDPGMEPTPLTRLGGREAYYAFKKAFAPEIAAASSPPDDLKHQQVISTP